MNYRALWAITLKDMQAIRSSTQIWLPMVVVPLIFTILFPALLIGMARYGSPQDFGNLDQVVRLLDKLPQGALREAIFAWNTPMQRLLYFGVNYFFAPLFLMIPLMASSIISANSFAGEKEAQTLESLLFAPIDIESLFMGKLLAAFIPALALTFGCAVIYGTVVNLGAAPVFGKWIFPSANWVVLILWVTPALSLMAIFFTVRVSAKVRSFQEAYQLGGLVILPVLGLLFSQMAGVLFLDVKVLFWIGAGILVLDGILIKIIRRYLNRNQLFESQVG